VFFGSSLVAELHFRIHDAEIIFTNKYLLYSGNHPTALQYFFSFSKHFLTATPLSARGCNLSNQTCINDAFSLTLEFTACPLGNSETKNYPSFTYIRSTP